MKIALVHEFLNQFGGAERVLLALHEIFPEAPIYALLYEPTKVKGINPKIIQTSFLQKWPQFLKSRHKLLLPLYPLAVEQFDLSGFDIIISDSNSFAKGILTRSDAIHICYCHTPTAYLWHYFHEYLQEQRLSNITESIVKKMLHRLRIWDYQAAQRVDYFIANSKNVQRRIKKYYGRDSEVIYPPVDIENLKLKTQNSKLQLKTRNYFLIVSRLSAYKRVDLAIRAFNKFKERLIVIGEGSELFRLKKMAKSNIEFLGFQSDEKIKDYYQNCRAFIFPGEEDFGLTPIEAMACGKPVIAYKKGGVLESVIENKTGVFFQEPTAESLLDAINRFKKIESQFNPSQIRKQAEKFDKKIFQKKIKEFIKDHLK
jgi:glycosyltransferase involved in cell wall biosynthesis